MESTTRNPAAANGRSRFRRTIVSGIVAGQLAGLVMAGVVMIVFALVLGKNLFFPVQVIGSALFGESALKAFNPAAILAGVLLHQAGPSLLWGIVFGLLASGLAITSVRSSLALGILIGVVSMIGPYLLIPAVMNALHGTDFRNREVPLLWDWAAHIVFGLSFAVFPAVLHRCPDEQC